MPLMMNRLEGRDGTATIKGLGTLVGEIATWTITRRGEEGPSAGLFDLRAVFSFLVPSLLLDPDYNEDRALLLAVARGRNIIVRLDDPARINLQGRVLFMEGVNWEWSR